MNPFLLFLACASPKEGDDTGYLPNADLASTANKVQEYVNNNFDNTPFQITNDDSGYTLADNITSLGLTSTNYSNFSLDTSLLYTDHDVPTHSLANVDDVSGELCANPDLANMSQVEMLVERI